MADIKWIKITTTMFDDEKIKLIESMPDCDSILIIWIKLLAQAGKCNATGHLILSQNIPYTDEMLSSIFNRPLNTIRMALDIFKRFGMIDLFDNCIYIANWEKHQNVDGMERVRELARVRKQKQRDKEKEKTQKLLSRDSHVPSSQCHSLDLDLDLDLDLEKDIIVVGISEIVSFYENNGFGLMLPLITDYINSFLDDGIEPDLIIEVMKYAVGRKANNWGYVSKILSNCLTTGIKTKNAYLAEKTKRDDEKKKQYIPKPSKSNFDDRIQKANEEVIRRRAERGLETK